MCSQADDPSQHASDDTLRAARGYVLEYDAEYRWLVMSDPEGASQIVAKEVLPDDAAYLIAGYAALAASATDERPFRGHLTERFDHDGTFRHHHDSITRNPIWWEHAEQFGGEKREHRHAASATDEHVHTAACHSENCEGTDHD